LRFFKAFVERRRQGTVAASDFAGDREYGIERPGCAFLESFVRVVSWVEEGNEEVAAGEETEGE
jgi:hypothetical protein